MEVVQRLKRLPQREGAFLAVNAQKEGFAFMYDLQFARRFDGVSGSAIRDIFKLLGQPGMISFAGGNPAWDALDNETLSQIARDVLAGPDGKALLQYGATEGWKPLREQTARFLCEEVGIDVAESEILPTTGSTQAVDLLLKALVNPGDTVLVEGPSFLGSLQAMRIYGANLVEIPMDEQGLDIDALERAAIAYRPKMLYTIPNFQNPTGVTLSTERRKEIARLAARYGFVVAEDDPYRGLRYAGNHLPSIFSFDTEGLVVYLTSFSKLISPGTRVGAAVVKNPQLLRKLVIGKQSTDLHTPLISQALVAEYLARDLLGAHMEKILGMYARQLQTMQRELAALPVKVFPTQGGLFVWCALKADVDTVALLQKCIRNGVAYVPGTHFYANGGHLNTLRLNFSNSTPEQIVQGVAALKKSMEEE